MKLEKLIGVGLGIAVIMLLSLALSGAIWLLWCWVMPQLWTTGPKNVVSPSFWLFYALLFLLGLVRNWLVPSKD
jgi:multisubunit Na+/H+ antiporter MnhB subunit